MSTATRLAAITAARKEGATMAMRTPPAELAEALAANEALAVSIGHAGRLM